MTVKAQPEINTIVNKETHTFYALNILKEAKHSLKHLNLMFPSDATDFSFLKELVNLEKLVVHSELDSLYTKSSKPPVLFSHMLEQTT